MSAQTPEFTRNLLRVKVPVSVTLAETRMPLGRIVELTPGTVIRFDRPPEQGLDLTAGGCKIARGEVVQMGKRLGLRIRSVGVPASAGMGQLQRRGDSTRV
jgi:flagellar motor switch protein FliN